MNGSFFESKTFTVLRWMFFLPLALLVSSIASLLGLLFELLRGYLGMSEGGEWSLMVAPVIGAIAFYSFVYHAVPKFKFMVLYILFGINTIYRVLGVIFYDENADNLLSFKGLIILNVLLVIVFVGVLFEIDLNVYEKELISEDGYQTENEVLFRNDDLEEKLLSIEEIEERFEKQLLEALNEKRIGNTRKGKRKT